MMDRLKKWLDRYFEMRLNAAPVQQVSVPDGYVLADKKALGTVLQALVNAPHHIRELQVTRTPVELFSDNPINVLIANYAAPAAPAADAGLVLEQAMYALIGIGYHENSGLVHELRQSLAAHRAKGVV